eukprot:3724129-Rhodomonas_salina.1
MCIRDSLYPIPSSSHSVTFFLRSPGLMHLAGVGRRMGEQQAREDEASRDRRRRRREKEKRAEEKRRKGEGVNEGWEEMQE